MLDDGRRAQTGEQNGIDPNEENTRVGTRARGHHEHTETLEGWLETAR